MRSCSRLFFGRSTEVIRNTIQTSVTDAGRSETLTDPTYRGDEHYPVGVEPYALGIENDPEDALGPNWKLELDEMDIIPWFRRQIGF